MCFSGSYDRFDTLHGYVQTIYMEIPHFHMGIEVMTIWEKLLANARNQASLQKLKNLLLLALYLIKYLNWHSFSLIIERPIQFYFLVSGISLQRTKIKQLFLSAKYLIQFS